MIDTKRFNRLREEVEQAKIDASKAEGALEQLMEQLVKEHKCTTIKQAERKAAELEKAAKDAEDAYNEALEAFETDWADKVIQ